MGSGEVHVPDHVVVDLVRGGRVIVGQKAGGPGPAGSVGGEVGGDGDAVVADGGLQALGADGEQLSLGGDAEEDDVGDRRGAGLAAGQGLGIDEGSVGPAGPSHCGAEVVDGHGPVEGPEDHGAGEDRGS